ncbi:MAG: hypothetical protein AAB653_02925 [Patescibacteria group bacterium]
MARKFSKISLDVLKVLAVTGIILIAATSPYFVPNLIKVLSKQNKNFGGRSYSKKDTEQAMRNLKRSRLVIFKEKDGKFFIELTDKGKRVLREVDISELKNKKPSQWDGLWRIVIFDIPEGKKYGRSALRDKMKEVGFYQLQKSVWVFPYECEKEVDLLVEVFDINSFVNIITAKKIKDDEKLKKYFKIS